MWLQRAGFEGSIDTVSHWKVLSDGKVKSHIIIFFSIGLFF